MTLGTTNASPWRSSSSDFFEDPETVDEAWWQIIEEGRLSRRGLESVFLDQLTLAPDTEGCKSSNANSLGRVANAPGDPG